MRQLLLALSLLLPLPGVAQDISAGIAADGLAATEARLADLPAPGDDERFALAAVRFLGAVETALQTRYRYALSPELSMIPVLRLPVPPNPQPDRFEAGVVADLFRGIWDRMDAVQAPLAEIPEGSDFGLVLRPADLWFDIDADGSRGAGEDVHSVLGPMLLSRTGFDPATLPAIEIRFDVADAHWLAAYAHLLKGVASAVLAYDPTAAIEQVMTAKAGLRDLSRDMPMANALDMTLGGFVDSASAIWLALAQQPHRGFANAAHHAFTQMIAENRSFWRLAAAEADDDREWIPNDAQASALGLTVPAGTGDRWLAVLDDAEALLDGRLLIPYWRLGAGAGIDLKALFLEPRPVDPVGWVQGYAALPYAKAGPRISAESWRAFNQLVEGRGLMFALLFN